MLTSFLFREFLLHIPCWLYLFYYYYYIILGGSLTLGPPQPTCWLLFLIWGVSYTFRVGFFFLLFFWGGGGGGGRGGVSLTHP